MSGGQGYVVAAAATAVAERTSGNSATDVHDAVVVSNGEGVRGGSVTQAERFRIYSNKMKA